MDLIRLFCLSFCLNAIFILCFFSSGNAQQCKDALELVSEYFDEASLDTSKYDKIIEQLTDCPPGETFDKPQHKIRAYEFLIAAYWQSAKKDTTEAFEKKQRENAVDKIKELLDLTKNKYEPKGAILGDKELSERVIKIKRDRRPWYQKYWYVWTPVLASGVGAYMLTRESPAKQLPGPPKVEF